MPRITTPRRYDALNSLFLLQESGQLQPESIGEEILWTIPWLPESFLYQQEFNRETVTGAAGADATGTTVPAGELWFVPVASSCHNSAAANIRAEIRLLHVASGGYSVIRSEPFNDLTTNFPLALQRPVIVPAGHALQAIMQNMAGPAVATLRYFYCRVKWGEPLPKW